MSIQSVELLFTVVDSGDGFDVLRFESGGHDVWEIEDTRTGKRCGVAGYLTEKQALDEIAFYWDRYRRGGRPDIKPRLLSAMRPRRVDVG